MNVSMDKKYKTRAGHPVRIFCIDAALNLPRHQTVVGLITTKPENEIVGMWLSDGRFDVENPHHYFDLVEVTPWDDLKINDPVIAKIAFNRPFKAHFAGVINGCPAVFINGCTAWTSDAKPLIVSIVSKPTEAEMAIPLEEEKVADLELKFDNETMASILMISKLKGITPEEFIISGLETFLKTEHLKSKG